MASIQLWVAALIFAWGLSSILYQYQWYFPPNFELSDFLNGRRVSFRGTYQWAFNVHLVSGPIALVLAALLVLSGGLIQFRRAHRFMGRLLTAVVVLGLLPSGMVMATQAYAGPIAGWGFVSLAIATAVCTTFAVIRAIRKQFVAHRWWAIRSFILLCSPMLLRFVSSGLGSLEIQSDWTYRLNAWLSWLLPLLIFEAFRKRTNSQDLAKLEPKP